ncbi:MAG: NAD-dependent epimerase/dehydratase family protein [Nocardioides sp.]
MTTGFGDGRLGADDRVWAPAPNFWRNRPVAITGATGFVGSHLTAMLVDLGASVITLVRDHLPVFSHGETPPAGLSLDRVVRVSGDVQDQAVLERLLGEYGVKTVIHLAAQSQVGVANRNPIGTFESNVRGTWALLEAVRRSAGVEQVVTASSDKAYGGQTSLPYTEETPLAGVNPYDASKACADLIAQSYHRTFSVPVAITRCGNFFGPGDLNWNRLVPGTIRSLLLGERPVIRSDGTMVRDYLYVVDGALAYLQLVEAMAAGLAVTGEAFNLSLEQPLAVLELVDRIQKAVGTELEPDIRAEASHEIDRQFLSSAKARDLLGWLPRFTLDEGLAATVDWYRSYVDTETG